jgi:hypothetical protein
MSPDSTIDPTLRIGDADREHAAAALGRHLSVGRLTMAEFETRLDTAYAATTRAELDSVLADLPAQTRPSPPPPRRVSLAPPPWPPRAPDASRASWVPWTLTGVICLLIWIATSAAQGHPDYFWPIWVIGPWGALLLVDTAIARTRPPHRSTSSNASPVAESSA